MIGSTIIEGIFITSNTPRNNVIVCAKVKIEICSIKGFNLEERRNKARTNNIWSKPLGIMCLKPSWVYDLILSISFSSLLFVMLNQSDLSPLSISFEYRSSLFLELTRRIIDPKFLSQENFKSPLHL